MEYAQYIASDNMNYMGAMNTLACIKGTTKKLGAISPSSVFLFNPLTQKILITTSDVDGSYKFLGLPKGQKFVVFARDDANQYNAVIQDNVVPK